MSLGKLLNHSMSLGLTFREETDENDNTHVYIDSNKSLGGNLGGNGEEIKRRKIETPYPSKKKIFVEPRFFDPDVLLEEDTSHELYSKICTEKYSFVVHDTYCIYFRGYLFDIAIQVIFSTEDPSKFYLMILSFNYAEMLKIIGKRLRIIVGGKSSIQDIYNEEIVSRTKSVLLTKEDFLKEIKKGTWKENRHFKSFPFERYYHHGISKTEAIFFDLHRLFSKIRNFNTEFYSMLDIFLGKQAKFFTKKHTLEIKLYPNFIDYDYLKFLYDFLLDSIKTFSFYTVRDSMKTTHLETYLQLFPFDMPFEENEPDLMYFYFFCRLIIVEYLLRGFPDYGFSDFDFTSTLLEIFGKLNDHLKKTLVYYDEDRLSDDNNLNLIINTLNLGTKEIKSIYKFTGLPSKVQKVEYPLHQIRAINESLNFDEDKFRQQSNHVYLWHGTGNERLPSLLQNGFSIGVKGRTTADIWFGHGIYFTPSFETAMFYAYNPTGVPGSTTNQDQYFVLLLCEIALGEQKKTHVYDLDDGFFFNINDKNTINRLNKININDKTINRLNKIKDIDIIQVEGAKIPKDWITLPDRSQFNDNIGYPSQKFTANKSEKKIDMLDIGEYVVCDTNLIKIRYVFIFENK